AFKAEFADTIKKISREQGNANEMIQSQKESAKRFIGM
ncbi:MAG: hypothetical protein ACJAWV_002994, partial [Flammeovirgaceae bacterium]